MSYTSRLNRNHEKLSLFTELKQTVECILSKRSANIWNVYGGFQSMLKCLDNILQHGYKPISKKNQPCDFWPFVKNLEWLDLTKTSFSYHVRNDNFLQQNAAISTKYEASSENNGRKWLEHNLRELTLYRRLQTLLSNTQLVTEYYEDWSFLLDSRFLKAFFTSIKALEANNPSILANLSPQMFGQELDDQSWDCEEPKTMRTNYPTSRDEESKSDSATNPFDLLHGCESPTVSSNCASTSQHHFVPSLDSRDDLDDARVKPGSQTKGSCWRPPLFDDNSSGEEETDSQIQISTSTKSYCPSIVSQQQVAVRTSSTCKLEAASTRKSSGDDAIARGALPDVVPSVEKAPTVNERSVESGDDDGAISTTSAHFEGLKLYSSDLYACGSDTDERQPMSSQAEGDDDGGGGEFLFPSGAVGFHDSTCEHRSTASLVDFLRNQDLATCADIDKENAHFYFADIMISTLEQMKCDYATQCRKMRQQKHDEVVGRENRGGDVSIDDGATTSTTATERSSSFCSTSAASLPASSNDVDQNKQSSSSASTSATVSKFHFGRAEAPQEAVHDTSERKLSHHRHASSYTAEMIAIGLLQSVSSQNTSAPVDQMKWLISEDDVPQKLLPIPDSVVVDSDMVSISSHWSSEHGGRRPDSPTSTIRIRGNQEWAPPRNQIIVKAPEKLSLKKSMEKQNNRCSGCGTVINKGAFKRLRYCEYLGKYFCTCCHENRTAVIPSRVLQCFDFSKYKVSNFSFDHLERMFVEPLYNVADINAKLYKKNKSLAKIRKLREQLPALHLYIRSCRFVSESSDQSCQEDDTLVSCSPKYLFDQLPPHFLTNDYDVFSIDDLIQCKNGSLLIGLKLTHQVATEHLEKCELCRMKGFICEFCNDASDIIFSHQEKTATCGDCKACYHSKCFEQMQKNCPKCERLKKRKLLLRDRSLTMMESPASNQ